jgi:hypothetical protein
MDRSSAVGRRLRTVALAVTVALATALLLVATALGALLDPDAEQELADDLAATPEVQQLVAGAVADALLTDVAARAPLVAPLLPALRPVLVTLAVEAIGSEAGTAALATAIADAVLQAATSGPIVVDLRAALITGAASAPEPIGSLTRAAALDGGVGLVVLRGDGRSAQEVLAARAAAGPSPSDVGPRVLGMTPRTARLLAAVLLVAGVLLLVAPASVATSAPGSASGRAVAVAWAGAGVLAAAAPAALVLRRAPALLVARLTASSPSVGAPSGATSGSTTTAAEVGPATAPTLDATLEARAPQLAAGVERLLTTTRMLADALTLVALLAVVAALALVAHRRSRPASIDAHEVAS